MAADVPHDGRVVLPQRLEPLSQVRADDPAALDEALLLQDPDRLPSGGASERMGPEREPVWEARPSEDRAPRSLEDDRAEGRVATGQPLREDHRVGGEPHRLGAGPPPPSPQARDYSAGPAFYAV